METLRTHLCTGRLAESRAGHTHPHGNDAEITHGQGVAGRTVRYN